ncbi:glycoside hydrolase family 28 protein [Formosa sp. 4Alg 33]|uniref:glycoside hydrolase family 28 protein n=1 Tax=Formosa sp. 4Alg 33 TaxID=3382189 RepID=UPI003D9C4721
MNRLVLFLLIGITFWSCAKVEKQQNIKGELNQPPIPGWIDKVGAETFKIPEQTFLVNDYGAINDGVTLNTVAIQKAIDACAEAGGGTVVFKPGRYLSGSIFIKKNIRFRIDKGVTILGSERIQDYKDIDTRVAGIEINWPAALINVRDQDNVIIEGDGIVDGQGKVFWDYYWKLRNEDYEPRGLRWIVDYDARRPRTILISDAKNVVLKDLQLQKAGFWTVQVLYSEYITVDGLTIRNNIGGHGPSTDGIDIDSSTYVLVQNCDIDCNDDNFCLKAGRDWDGLRVNKPTEYIVIKDCIARRGAGLFTIGSETSGSIRHVYVSNIIGLGTKNGLNIKSATTRGGTVEDIYLQNIKMDSVGTFMKVTMNWNPTYSYSKLPKELNQDSIPTHWKKMLKHVEPASKGIPTFKNINLSNIDVKGAKTAINVNGLEASIIENFILKNVSIEAETAGKIHYSKGWTLDNVTIKTKDSSRVSLEHTSNIVFTDKNYHH